MKRTLDIVNYHRLEDLQNNNGIYKRYVVIPQKARKVVFEFYPSQHDLTYFVCANFPEFNKKYLNFNPPKYYNRIYVESLKDLTYENDTSDSDETPVMDGITIKYLEKVYLHSETPKPLEFDLKPTKRKKLKDLDIDEYGYIKKKLDEEKNSNLRSKNKREITKLMYEIVTDPNYYQALRTYTYNYSVPEFFGMELKGGVINLQKKSYLHKNNPHIEKLWELILWFTGNDEKIDIIEGYKIKKYRRFLTYLNLFYADTFTRPLFLEMIRIPIFSEFKDAGRSSSVAVFGRDPENYKFEVDPTRIKFI